MSSVSRFVLAVGFLAVAATLAMPPWEYTLQLPGYPQATAPAGSHFVFGSPVPRGVPREDRLSALGKIGRSDLLDDLLVAAPAGHPWGHIRVQHIGLRISRVALAARLGSAVALSASVFVLSGLFIGAVQRARERRRAASASSPSPG